MGVSCCKTRYWASLQSYSPDLPGPVKQHAAGEMTCEARYARAISDGMLCLVLRSCPGRHASLGSLPQMCCVGARVACVPSGFQTRSSSRCRRLGSQPACKAATWRSVGERNNRSNDYLRLCQADAATKACSLHSARRCMRRVFTKVICKGHA